MYIQIYHTRTKELKTVRELDDLSFEDGWRYKGQVSTSKVCPFTLDQQSSEAFQRKEEGFIDMSNLTLEKPRS